MARLTWNGDSERQSANTNCGRLSVYRVTWDGQDGPDGPKFWYRITSTGNRGPFGTMDDAKDSAEMDFIKLLEADLQMLGVKL